MSVIVGYRIADDGGDEIAESGCRISRQDGAAMSDGEKETTIMQTGSVGADGFYRLRIGNLQPSTGIHSKTIRQEQKRRGCGRTAFVHNSNRCGFG